jgi:hypothetical protein
VAEVQLPRKAETAWFLKGELKAKKVLLPVLLGAEAGMAVAQSSLLKHYLMLVLELNLEQEGISLACLELVAVVLEKEKDQLVPWL